MASEMMIWKYNEDKWKTFENCKNNGEEYNQHLQYMFELHIIDLFTNPACLSLIMHCYKNLKYTVSFNEVYFEVTYISYTMH